MGDVASGFHIFRDGSHDSLSAVGADFVHIWCLGGFEDSLSVKLLQRFVSGSVGYYDDIFGSQFAFPFRSAVLIPVFRYIHNSDTDQAGQDSFELFQVFNGSGYFILQRRMRGYHNGYRIIRPAAFMLENAGDTYLVIG